MSARKKSARALALAYLGARMAKEVELDQVVREHVDRVMDATSGNVSLAADLLGMHRRSLQRYQRRQKRKRGKR